MNRALRDTPKAGFFLLLTSIALIAGEARALTGIQEASYFADVPSDNDQFGFAVALDRDFALVGANASPRNVIDAQTGSTDFGAAFVFDRNTHQLADTITASDFNETGLFFGARLDVDGGVAVISNTVPDPFENPRSKNAVAVYDIAGEQAIDYFGPPASGPETTQGFGSAVAIYGNELLVGSPSNSGVPNPSTQTSGGTVHLYGLGNPIGQPLSELGTLSPQTTPQYLRFGTAAALNDQYAVVGGGVFPSVYVYDATTRQALHEIELTRSGLNDAFVSVDIDGGVAVVGFESITGSEVWLVDLESGSLLRELIPDARRSREYGRSVAIDDGLVVVGDPNTNDQDGVITGSAYVFDAMTGQQLTELQLEADPDFFRPFLFGQSVDIDGDRVLVGSMRGGRVSGNGPFGHGGAFLFRLVPEPSSAAMLLALAGVLAGARRQPSIR